MRYTLYESEFYLWSLCDPRAHPQVLVQRARQRTSACRRLSKFCNNNKKIEKVCRQKMCTKPPKIWAKCTARRNCECMLRSALSYANVDRNFMLIGFRGAVEKYPLYVNIFKEYMLLIFDFFYVFRTCLCAASLTKPNREHMYNYISESRASQLIALYKNHRAPPGRRSFLHRPWRMSNSRTQIPRH